MEEAFRVAKERNVRSQEYNKEKYDSKVKEVGIEMGDQVLVKNLREKGGTGKLNSHWERQIFKVLKQQQDLPVYHVQNLKNPKDIRILHRNHLMKCEQLEEDVFEDEEEEKEPVKKNTRIKSKAVEKEKTVKKVKGGQEDVEEETNASDSDEVVGVIFYPSSVHQHGHRVGQPGLTEAPGVDTPGLDHVVLGENETTHLHPNHNDESILQEDLHDREEEPPAHEEELPPTNEEEPPAHEEELPSTNEEEPPSNEGEQPPTTEEQPPDEEELPPSEGDLSIDFRAEPSEVGDTEAAEEVDDDSEEEIAPRRSSRTAKPRSIFTIEKLGGNPSWSTSTG